jgi:amino acid transporter
MTTLRESPAAGTEAAPISQALFVGLTVAATGGPLALAAVYVPGILGDASASAALVALLAAALFVPALVVWVGYSRQVVGPGGLYAFVEAAAGRRMAQVQAGLWVLSYLLYLIYTITYIAYDLLPSAFPALGSVRPALQMVTAVVIAAVSMAPLRAAVAALAAVAGLQVVVTVVLATTTAGSQSVSAAAFATHGHPAAVTLAGANTSILFICASLPLFLGGEVAGGSVAVRRGLVSGWTVVAAVTTVAAVGIAAMSSSVLASAIPGVQLARDAGKPALAAVVGAGVALSVASVVVAEFLALSRLGHALTGRPVSGLSRLLAAVLVAGAAASLASPNRVYEDLLKPSLVALWLAQLVVFVVYPRLGARARGWRARDVVLAGAGSALMLFGLWSTVVNQVAT